MPATAHQYSSVTDAIGNRKRSYRDVRELIVAVVEEGSITTEYDYDFLKQITRVAYDKLGRRTVIIDYHRDDARAQIALGETWRVHPTGELLHRLRDSLGDDHVKVVY